MKGRKLEIVKISLSLFLLILGIILSQVIQTNSYVWLAVYLPAFLICGYVPIKKAVKNILKGRVFDENFLMSIAGIGALIIGEYPEAVAVMVFYTIGELFQQVAVERSRKSIESLVNIRPDYAYLLKGNEIEKVDPFDVNVGDVIVVKAGERVALDGVVINGNASFDLSALTGESLPVNKAEGDEILSGSINLSGVVNVRVTKEFSESTASKIIDMVENAASNKSKSENFISVFAKYYTPIVVLVALIVGIVPPIVDGAWSTWIYRALSFLVVSCPCALVISVPLGFFAGLGNASKNNVLVKGSNYLEMLSKVDVFAFDKTGTLTKGNFAVTSEVIVKDEERFRKIIASVESFSNHPIATAISKKYDKYVEKDSVSDVTEIAGNGVKASFLGDKVLVGNKKLLNSEGINVEFESNDITTIYLTVNGEVLGYVLIEDELKEGSKALITSLKNMGKKTVMLTGDNEVVANKIASAVGVDEVRASLLPSDKLDVVSKLKEQGKVAFVGDGINDAPVIAGSDLGIAMGKIGSDIAVETADIVLMNDEPTKLLDGIKIARKTTAIVQENVIFSIGVKLLVLVLSGMGIANMWLAVFADVGVSVIAVLNSVRMLKYKPNKSKNKA